MNQTRYGTAANSSRRRTLYSDEPTTRLHPADVDKLVLQPDRLVQAGNTVIVVEHDMRVVAASDWVIDVGPGAGDERSDCDDRNSGQTC